MATTTTNVRVWSIRTYDGVRGKTYNVRWIVGGRSFSKNHKSKPPAVKQRAELLKAARRTVPFDIYSGLPITQTCVEAIDATWYDHAVAFMDMKWPTLQPNSRRSLAAALATLTEAMTAQGPRRPDQELCIKALLNWSFNRTARAAGNPPPQYADAVAWVHTHSLKVRTQRPTHGTNRLRCDPHRPKR
jgi:hypothetical protein